MQGARYLRSQAELCLQMAHNVSDERVATNFRAASADYFSRAEQAESQTGSAYPEHPEKGLRPTR